MILIPSPDFFEAKKAGRVEAKAQNAKHAKLSIQAFHANYARARLREFVAKLSSNQLLLEVFNRAVTPNETQDQRPRELEMMLACSQS
jgi:hypothetical protein